MPKVKLAPNVIADHGMGRVIPCKQLDYSAPLRWLQLAMMDIVRAPGISLLYGLVFAGACWLIATLVYLTGRHLVILPSLVAFMLVGPLLAVGLYDISWSLEKNHKPRLLHSLRAMNRNPVHQWGFAVLLMVFMILWTRVAAMVHVLYPSHLGFNWEAILPFLAVGTALGAVFALTVFSISAFSLPLLMERRVDIVTAIVTSLNAVLANKGVMLVWAGVICGLVVISFATFFVGLIIFMPLVGYATWHAYIETITTTRDRHYN